MSLVFMSGNFSANAIRKSEMDSVCRFFPVVIMVAAPSTSVKNQSAAPRSLSMAARCTRIPVCEAVSATISLTIRSTGAWDNQNSFVLRCARTISARARRPCLHLRRLRGFAAASSGTFSAASALKEGATPVRPLSLLVRAIAQKL